ncbi:hypothetical protein BD779DRAFT_1669481 [Infundibulicybe gibba]|nr:hypothetical protein BD779DRAFT_1669481 [Infundibulicybe gibba]
MRAGIVAIVSIIWCLLGSVAAYPAAPEVISSRPDRVVLSPRFNSSDLPFLLDFWDEAQKLGQRAKTYVEEELNKYSGISKEIAQKVSGFKEAMGNLVNSTEHLRHTALESISNEHGISLHQISEKMSIELNATLAQLQLEFSEGEGSPGYDRRVLMVDRALELSSDALNKTFNHFNIPADKIQPHLNVIIPHVRHLPLDFLGNFVDAHADILESLLFSAAVMLIPESLILRPILGLFGFGPSGPLKCLNLPNNPRAVADITGIRNSVASWAQKTFFGAAIRKGSWFARLQAAGMTQIIRLPAIKAVLAWGLGVAHAMFKSSSRS